MLSFLPAARDAGEVPGVGLSVLSRRGAVYE